jgi:hypothetical protein
VRDVADFSTATGSTHAAKELELVLARPGEQSLYELGLAAEHKQQYARAGLHGGRQRPERKGSNPVLKYILIRLLEQFIATA